jgi:hypothetical protein
MAPPPLNVVFTTKGVAGLLTSLNKATKGFQSLNAAANGTGANSMAGRLVASGNHLRSAAVALTSVTANLRAAANALKSAGGGGSGKWAANGGMAPWKPPRIPALPKTLGQKLQQAFMTSRVGVGGSGGMQIMPLMSKLMALLPPQIQAAAMAIGAVVAVSKAMFDLAEKTAQMGLAFDKLSLALGSSGATSAAVGAMGGAMGMSPESMAGIAEGINSKISSDSMARAVAARMGVQSIGGFYGQQDYGKQLLSVVDGLRSISNRAERVQAARAMGATGLLGLAELSKGQFAKTQTDGALSSKIMTPEMQQQSADFVAATGRVGEAFNRLMMAIGKPMIAKFTQTANNVADVFNKLAELADAHPDLAGLIEKMMFPVFGAIAIIENIINATCDAYRALVAIKNGDMVGATALFKKSGNDLLGRDSAMNDLQGAIDRNTDATNALTGTFGRSARTAAAIPSGVSGEYMRRGLIASGLNFSGF